MAKSGAPRGQSGRRSGRLFTAVALAALAAQLLPELQVSDFADADAWAAFAAPSLSPHASAVGLDQQVGTKLFASGAPGPMPKRDASRTKMNVAAVSTFTGLGHKVLSAMGAGAVASVIQAALSAIGEPIVNRVLVKRMKVLEAIKDVKPSMMLDFFKTTLATNFLKFPFFEAINAICTALPINPSVRGLFTGFVFTSATLPVTNYRYRKSMQLEVNWGNIYEAYLPTVIRDIVYGIVRNYTTNWTLLLNPGWTAVDPQTLFIVVILGCLGSAPFNEWRGFLLQSKGQELTFREFFKPSNFVRSTSLGALQQGLALAVGYWCAPPVARFVHSLIPFER